MVFLNFLNSCRFDAELNRIAEDARQEKHQREVLQRERDALSGEKYTLEQQLNVSTILTHSISLSLGEGVRCLLTVHIYLSIYLSIHLSIHPLDGWIDGWMDR